MSSFTCASLARSARHGGRDGGCRRVSDAEPHGPLLRRDRAGRAPRSIASGPERAPLGRADAAAPYRRSGGVDLVDPHIERIERDRAGVADAPATLEVADV